MALVTDSVILRTRPSVVEAKQLSEDNREDLARWVGGWTHGMSEVRWFDRDSGGVCSAVIGDWIVRTAFGQHKRVSDSALLSQFERVTAVVSE